MRRTTSALTLALLFALTIPLEGRAAPEDDMLADLSPTLSWIRTQRFRGGYNYCADPAWFAEARAAGLNAIISRIEIANDPSGDEQIDADYPEGVQPPSTLRCWRLLRPTARAAKENGLHFFFMIDYAQDSANIKDGLRDNPRRHNNGERPSPIDEIYWTRVIEQRFVRAAQMLQGEEYAIDGFLIDSETYGFGGGTPGGVDFGDFALGEFVRETGVDLDFAAMTIDERRTAIADRGLLGELEQFQFERIRAMARRTRERVQALVPDAILGFFLWQDRVWYRAVAAGFATAQIPCWVGPEGTYPGAFDDQFLAYRQQVIDEAGVPILFVPGLRYGYEDGRVPAQFLKVLPGNLYHRAINTAGYWFWALGRLGATPQERAPFWEALRRTNEELDRYAASEGGYQSPLVPAPLPAETPANLQQLLTQAPQWRPIPAAALPPDAPVATGLTLRGMHTFVVPVHEGETIALDVKNARLGSYTADSAVSFFRPDGSRADEQHVALNERRRVELTADATGVWVVAITSHNNAFWALPLNDRAVLAADGPIHLCDHEKGPSNANRLFFYVPPVASEFGIAMTASEAEPATFRVFRPGGEPATEYVRLTRRVEETFVPGDDAGKVWWIETVDAAEDHSVELTGIPGIVAARADQLIGPE